MKTIIEGIAVEFNVTKKLAKELVDAVVNDIAIKIIEDGTIRLTGLGTFKVVDKAQKNGRNPFTGESIIIPAKKALKFIPCSDIKVAIQ